MNGNIEYNKWHSDHYSDDDISTRWHEFSKSCLRQVDLEGKTILEIGCGRGGFVGYLINTYPQIKQIYACDFSTSALDIGLEKYGTGAGKIIWQKEDIENISLPENCIDILISMETIEHVPNYKRAIKELYRVLKPNGMLIMTCPNYFNLFGLWCFYRKVIGKPYDEGGQPFVKYIKTPLVYLFLKRTGFKIKHFSSSDFTIPAKRPRHMFMRKLPKIISFLGLQTFYRAIK